MPVKVVQKSFHAWINAQPPGKPTLIVVGEVVAPTPGWNVTLKRRVPQGINPAILLLDLVATPPNGMVPDVVTPMPVRYVERPPKAKYTHVTIFYNGKSFTIPVGIVTFAAAVKAKTAKKAKKKK